MILSSRSDYGSPPASVLPPRYDDGLLTPDEANRRDTCITVVELNATEQLRDDEQQSLTTQKCDWDYVID
eukprot:CAMPEP_0172497574 /NCGR_PEP_ID=MMETSP1066-20121228/101688_1 /TAXON_ID=671091 /ORGANISM="Coscinodiscus wailesii, Strain CCMP2513" /LENGTH=69 /DNA_ID=CAMNT_0013270429 /DNA_START=23 /DNA_END=229 /DNA_ORIENTATION=+